MFHWCWLYAISSGLYSRGLEAPDAWLVVACPLDAARSACKEIGGCSHVTCAKAVAGACLSAHQAPLALRPRPVTNLPSSLRDHMGTLCGSQPRHTHSLMGSMAKQASLTSA